MVMYSSGWAMHRYSESAKRAMEAEIDKHFARQWAIKPVTRESQFAGIDRIWTHRTTGEEYAVEYKCDHRTAATHRVFIETVSNANSGRPGWVITSEADLLIYYCHGLGFAFRASMPKVQEVYEARWSGLKVRSAQNIGRDGRVYDTLGVCVNKNKFKRDLGCWCQIEPVEVLDIPAGLGVPQLMLWHEGELAALQAEMEASEPL